MRRSIQMAIVTWQLPVICAAENKGNSWSIFTERLEIMFNIELNFSFNIICRSYVCMSFIFYLRKLTSFRYDWYEHKHIKEVCHHSNLFVEYKFHKQGYVTLYFQTSSWMTLWPAFEISGHPVIREDQNACRMTTFSNLVIGWITKKMPMLKDLLWA